MMLETEESDPFNSKIAARRRAGSADETLIDCLPVLTTGWFDTTDEYEAHRRIIKNKLNVSASANTGMYAMVDKKKIYDRYKDMGGSKGSLILCGTDAWGIH